METAASNSVNPTPPSSFRELGLKAGNYLVEDMHIKGLAFLGLAALAWHCYQTNDLLTFAKYCFAGMGGAALGPKKS